MMGLLLWTHEHQIDGCEPDWGKFEDAVEYEADTEISADMAGAVEEALVDAGFELWMLRIWPMSLICRISKTLSIKDADEKAAFQKLIKQYKNAAIDAGWFPWHGQSRRGHAYDR